MAEATPHVPNPKRVAACRLNRAKRKGLTPRGPGEAEAGRPPEPAVALLDRPANRRRQGQGGAKREEAA
jgi:hypothetical protein